MKSGHPNNGRKISVTIHTYEGLDHHQSAQVRTKSLKYGSKIYHPICVVQQKLWTSDTVAILLAWQ
jgi:hypothetical protein